MNLYNKIIKEWKKDKILFLLKMYLYALVIYLAYLILTK